MSFLKKLTVWDLLFGVQIAFAVWFCYSQAETMLASTAGVNITWFIGWGMFSAMNFWLTLNLHRNDPSRLTIQLLTSYGVWGAGAICCAIVMLLSGNGVWNVRDWLNIAINITGFLAVALLAKHNGWRFYPVLDPMIKGGLAISFKALPQLVMSLNIAMIGKGDGVSVTALWMGHITVCIRLIQLAYEQKKVVKMGGEAYRNCTGSSVSEICNETSWIIVTITWMMNV